MQTKAQSVQETWTQTAIGYVIGLGVWYLILLSGAFDINTRLLDNLAITSIFTATSLARGYCVRRYYNRGQL